MDKITVSGGNLEYGYRDISDQGAGWTAANSLFWQGRASQTHCVTPPTAHNWAYGMWTQPYGNGYYQLSHTFIKPESIFYAQLTERTGKKQELEENKIFVYQTLETAKPTVEYAAWMSKQSLHPDIRMDKWIDSMIVSYPIDCSIHDIPEISQVKYKPRKEHTDAVKSAPLTIRNGWVTRGSQIMTRGTYPHKSEPRTTGWQGIGSLTLFYPGRTGHGYTEEPDSIPGNWKHREAMCCTTARDYGTNAGETIMNGTCRLTRRSGLLSTNIHTVAVEQEKHKTD